MSTSPSSRLRAAIWPALAVAIATVPVFRAFSTTNIFYIRDLAVFFWPRHLWLRDAWAAGDWPWWDPYAGAGQSAVADPLNHFFLLPVTAMRLVLPAVVGFNFWIAAPFPLLALGAWLWLRRHASPAAAAIGAAVAAVAGPVASTGDFPNMSWSVAFIPWMLWATDRLAGRERPIRQMVLLATLTGLQAVAGEPVTFAGSCALVCAYAAVVAHGPLLSQRLAGAARAGFALVAGLLLSAVQTMPMVFATRGSARSSSFDNMFWSLDPLAGLEIVAGHLFGHPYALMETLPWMKALNDGREPLLFSLYIGITVIAVACVSSAGHRVWRRFWIAAALASVICALGEHSVLYRGLQAAVPVLQSFRFPVKYLVFGVIALAALTAGSVDAIQEHATGRGMMRRPILAVGVAATVALLAFATVSANLLAPVSVSRLWEFIAQRVGVEPAVPAVDAAQWMLHSSMSHLLRVGGIAAGVAMLLTVVWTRHRVAVVAAWLLCAVAVLDPLSLNIDLHPTMKARLLGPPEWMSSIPSQAARTYVGGLINVAGARSSAVSLVDMPAEFPVAADRQVQEAISERSAQLAYTPAAWHVRQVISYDLPKLWPHEYQEMLDRFAAASREERLRFLQRAGVDYCYLPEPPAGLSPTPIRATTPETAPMALYACGSSTGSRTWVAPTATIEPNVTRQIERMFDLDHDPYARVLLERTSSGPAGRPSGARAPAATIVRERNTELVVSAGAGEGGGYLTVADSFDPWWTVTVDGQPTTLLRANGLFRAVHLAPGTHEVAFVYRPVPFYAGAAISLTIAVLLVGAALWRRHPVPIQVPELTASAPLRTMRLMPGGQS